MKTHFNLDPLLYSDVAFNGLDALNKVITQVETTGKNPYKLILMDQNMPKMDGSTST